MSYEFKLPDLGEGLTEGEIARWLVEEGQEIAEDAPLVEIATDKTTVEIPSPAAGIVSRILVEEGAVVPVGTVLVVIGGDGSVAEPADVEQPRAEPAPDQKAASDKSVTRGESSGDAADPEGRGRARRRPRAGDGHGPAGPDHRGGRPRGAAGGIRVHAARKASAFS